MAAAPLLVALAALLVGAAGHLYPGEGEFEGPGVGGEQRGWEGSPCPNGTPLRAQSPPGWGASRSDRRSSLAGGGKPLTLAFARQGSPPRAPRAGPGLEEPSPSARPAAGVSLERAADPCLVL